jgi:hypothetical protein
MTHTYSSSGILFAMLIAFLVIGVLIYNILAKSNKNLVKPISKDGDCIDFFDELLTHMSTVVGTKLDYADQVCNRQIVFKNLSCNKPYNNRQLACASVQIRFMLKVYPKGICRIVAYAESSYGSPSWDGKTMHYNYPIENDSFEEDVNNFQVLWSNIIEKFYTVDTVFDGQTDRVKEGAMSYWTEKQYGHLL